MRIVKSSNELVVGMELEEFHKPTDTHTRFTITESKYHESGNKEFRFETDDGIKATMNARSFDSTLEFGNSIFYIVEPKNVFNEDLFNVE